MVGLHLSSQTSTRDAGEEKPIFGMFLVARFVETVELKVVHNARSNECLMRSVTLLSFALQKPPPLVEGTAMSLTLS